VKTDARLSAGEAAERAGDYARAAAAYLEVTGSDDRRLVANAQFRLGRLAWRRSDFSAALRLYQTARTLATELGDQELLARVENGVGAVHYARGAYGDARTFYDRALALTRDEAARAKILLNLGVIANIEGDLEAARDSYLVSRAIARDLGDREGEAYALHNLGMLYADRGEWQEAREAYAQCLALAEAQGNRQMAATLLINEAELHCRQGRFDDAVSACERSLAILSEIGDEVTLGEALRWQGVAYLGLGAFGQARPRLMDALRIASRTGSRLLEAETMRDLGITAAAEQDLSAARQWLNRALDEFTALGAARDVQDVAERIDRLGPQRTSDEGRSHRPTDQP
jgi:tetratricopeptide (TPR) repeat protein